MRKNRRKKKEIMKIEMRRNLKVQKIRSRNLLNLVRNQLERHQEVIHTL